jgi:hypothetical protein
VNEALRQVLELQAVLLAARPRKTIAMTLWGSRQPATGLRDQKTSGVLELWGARPLPG